MENKRKHIILAAGGDLRMSYAARGLCGEGMVYGLGIPAAEGVRPISDLRDMEDRADILLLPMMAPGDEVPLMSGGSQSLGALTAVLSRGALVAGGRLSPAQVSFFEAIGFEVRDYFKDEALVIRNCIPTAEGALMIAMQELPVTVFGSSVLIVGFGRVAKACARLFGGAGARCTAAARSPAALAEAASMGLDAIPLRELPDRAGDFDIVLNTVPAPVLDRPVLRALPPAVLIIDLASAPGGADREAARELSRRVIMAPGLPGKVAPVTAGEYISQTVKTMIYERGK